MTMTLHEAIVFVRDAKPGPGVGQQWDAVNFKFGVEPVPIDHAIASIMNAAASGDLIPKADADLAVALALREAADACKYLHVIKTQDRHGPWNSAVLQCCELILALAPADALAEVQALKADLQRFRDERTYVIGAIDGWDAAVEQGEVSTAVDSALVRFWKRLTERHLDRAEAAEAEVARLRSYLASCVAMIEHAIGPGKDVFIEPDTGRKLSDARAALATPEKDATK